MNWQRLVELRAEVGAEALSEVLEVFLAETDEVVDRLRDGVAPGRLEEELHFLKGAALNIGFDELAELCRRGEVAARDGLSGQIDTAAVCATYDVSRADLLKGAPDFGLQL